MQLLHAENQNCAVPGGNPHSTVVNHRNFKFRENVMSGYRDVAHPQALNLSITIRHFPAPGLGVESEHSSGSRTHECELLPIAIAIVCVTIRYHCPENAVLDSIGAQRHHPAGHSAGNTRTEWTCDLSGTRDEIQPVPLQ